MYERIEKTISGWSDRKAVQENELFQFFESVKETAGTIGMEELSKEAEKNLAYLDEESDQLWKEDKWTQLTERIQNESAGGDLPSIHLETAAAIDSVPSQDVPTILIIDDDLEFVSSVKAVLKGNYFQVVTAVTGEKGLELFYEINPGVIVVSNTLPDGGGLPLLNQIISKAQKDLIPIVMVSSEGSTEHRIEAYELGALDFIGKPINPSVFVPFLRNRLMQRENILRHIQKDYLTGAYKKDALEPEMLDQLEKIKLGESARFSFALADLDFFYSVNQKRGHAHGDEVLRELVRLFLQMKKPEDKIFRSDGGEFAVVLPGKSAKEALAFLDQWREAFTQKCGVTFSAGLLSIAGKTSLLEGQITVQAKKALFHAKETGRSKTVLYEEEESESYMQGQLNLIVVDDDQIVRELLKHHFTKRREVNVQSMTIKTFEDGISFLESDWYRKDQQYMILIDRVMPKMNGLEVIKEVRERYGGKNILICLLVPRQGESEITQALAVGVDDFMMKPFNVQEVASKIDRMTERTFS
ncbi:response regulator [Jeotgalibacillus proteolyticus]|nr:response regulator [Jeotgalibacillus proteolyticus]